LNGRGGGFRVAEGFREEPGKAEFARGGLKAEGLIEPEEAPDEAEEAGLHEELLHGEPADEVASWIFNYAALLDVSAGVFEEIGVVDAGRARGGAGEAAEAVAHFVGEAGGGFEFAVGDGAHEGDATARGVSLATGFGVGGAGG
jgi:hypothetical protein